MLQVKLSESKGATELLWLRRAIEKRRDQERREARSRKLGVRQ